MFDKLKCTFGFHKWSEWEYKNEGSCIQIRHCTRCIKKQEEQTVHKWSDWEYVSEKSCILVKHCLRCTEKETKEEHNWSGWRSYAAAQKEKIALEIDILKKERDNTFEEYRKVQQTEKLIDQKASEYTSIDNKIKELEARLKEENTAICKQVKTCSRCSKEETRYVHNMSLPQYVSNDNCKMVKTCENTGCNYKEYLDDERHIWGEWLYMSPNNCYLVRRCTRCPAHENSVDEKHKWGVWQAGLLPLEPCRIARRCEHCNNIEKRNEYKHSWGDWVPCAVRDGNIDYNRVKSCAFCPEKVYGSEHHGKILSTGFYDEYRHIADYITNFNEDFAKKKKKDIIKATQNIAKINNETYPTLPLDSLPAITQIVKMLKNSSEESIRLAAMQAIMNMRRMEDPGSEKVLAKLFSISLTDESRELRKAAESYLHVLDQNTAG